jgi:hypothetical protein
VTIIAASTGLIGATGGIIISVLTLRHAYRKDRHILKLEISEGIMLQSDPASNHYNQSEDRILFKVANVGVKDFTITQLGIKIGKHTGGVIINQPFGTVELPYVLKPDTTCDFWAESKGLNKSVKSMVTKHRLYNKVKITAYVRDYIGNSIKSNKLKIVLKKTRIDKLKEGFSSNFLVIKKFFRP